MPEENEPAQSPPPEQSTLLGNVAPDEMLARGMQSVRMTSGATGTWQPPAMEECARLFPGYEVLRLLGRGGMGAVYQARQIELDRLVAIKLLPLEISVDKDFADRFRREARAMAKLNHPNIIAVYDFGTTQEGHLFFVMEFVEGANLYDIIHQVGLDGDQSLSIVEQVCTALAYAHGKGIVHRDIKPANVMIDTESHVKVADFGLARLTDPGAMDLGHTMTGTVMGTPDYMAPEQMKGMNVDHRADIYSVGVMLYEMLCREVPKGIFDPPSHRTPCDARIDQIVIRSLQQAPDRRYQSTTEMKSDILAARHPVVVPNVEPAAPVSASPAKPSPPGAPKKPAPPKAPGAAAPKKPSPPSPAKPVVMQAIPLPGAKKSKLPLYAGLGVVVVVIAAAAFFLLKPKEEKLTQAQIYAREHSNETKDAGPSAVAEHWQDLLGDPAKLRLSDGAERMPEGLRLSTDGGKARVVAGSKLPRDAALRLRTTFGDGRPFLHGRVDNRMGYYDLGATVDGNTIRLGLFQQSSQNKINLRDFPLPKPLRRGQEYNLELRIVGQSLTAKLNDEIVGTFVDATLSQGEFEVVGADRIMPSVLVKSLEFLDLDTPANASSSLAPTKPSPASAAAAPAPHLSPSSEPWVDAMKNANLLKVAVKEGPALRMTEACKGLYIDLTPVSKDGAVRMLFTVDPTGIGLCSVNVRQDSPSFYHLHIEHSLEHIGLGVVENGTSRTLKSLRLPVETQRAPGQPNELELRAVGAVLVAKVNGVEVVRFEDKTLPQGHLGIRLVPGALLYAVQTLDLSKSSAPPSSSTSSPVAPKTGKEINLLSLVDLKRDVVQGTWSVTPAGLSLDSNDKFGICELPYEPPKEYDFEAEFTPTSGGNNVNLHLAAGGASFIWKLNAHARLPSIYGIDLLDGKFMNARTEGVVTTPLQLEAGKRYTTRAEVRTGGLRALVNGNEMLTWSGDFSRLSTEPSGRLRNERALGVGAYGRKVVFHRLEVLEVTGHGKLTATAAPSGGSAASAPASSTPPLTRPSPTLLAPGSEAGFRPLFDSKTLAGWSGYDGVAPSAAWKAQDGAVTVTGERSWLVTKDVFGDFELRLEWKVGPNGNGGIFFHMSGGEGGRPLTAPEFQLCARDVSDAYKTGTLYNVLHAPEDASLPTGEWNTARLVVQGGRCEHWVNDRLVLSYDLKSEEWKKQWQASKFANDPRFAQAAQGWIALQGWTGEIAYRNIRICPLPAASAETRPQSVLTGQPVDLLALVQLPRDILAGQWTRAANGLSVASAVAGPAGTPRIEIPFDPPDEYDLDFEFTTDGPGAGIGPALPTAFGSCSFMLGYSGGYYGFEQFDGRRVSDQTTIAAGLATKLDNLIDGGKRHHCHVEVRRDSLRALLDEREITKWSGNLRLVQSGPQEIMRTRSRPGLFAFGHAVTFHSVVIRAATGGTPP